MTQKEIKTDSDYWDCECKENYIRLKKSQQECSLCDCFISDQPDSRVAEIKK